MATRIVPDARPVGKCRAIGFYMSGPFSYSGRSGFFTAPARIELAHAVVGGTASSPSELTRRAPNLVLQLVPWRSGKGGRQGPPSPRATVSCVG